MLTTKDFVFLHAPKTGGTFVRSVLEEYAPDSWDLINCNRHILFDSLADNLEPGLVNLPKFGFVRNPWDWYVSWYHYYLDSHDQEFIELSGSKTLGFERTMHRWIDKWGSCASYMELWLGPLWGETRIGRLENISGDLLRFLSAYAENVPRVMEDIILQGGRVNRSYRGRYQTYYNSLDLREKVATVDASLIEKFDYTF